MNVSTNLLSSWLGHATDAVNQIEQLPFSLLLLVVLIVLGGVLKMLALFPNKWIPAVIFVVGTVANGYFGAHGSVGPDQTPEVVLAFRGFLVGATAWTLHATILKRFEKYVPLLAGKTGDTDSIEKPKA